MKEQALNELFPPPSGAELRRIARTYWGWVVEFQAKLNTLDEHGSSLGNVTGSAMDEVLEKAYDSACTAFNDAITEEITERERKRHAIASQTLAVEVRFGNLDEIGPEV